MGSGTPSDPYILASGSSREHYYSQATKDPDKLQTGGDHYKKMAIQPTEYIISNNLTFAEGNVIKYVSRHKVKGKSEDIRKAIHYLQLILKHEYGMAFAAEEHPRGTTE